MFVFFSIIIWFTFIYWQLYTPTNDDTKWYSKSRKDITGAPPNWLFGIVWFILYGLISASAILFFDENDNFVWIFVVFFANIVLNKTWTLVFFRQKQTLTALIIAITMIATEISVLIGFGLENAWLSFGLYIPYLTWTIYALYLNIRMHQIHGKQKNVLIQKHVYNNKIKY